MKTNVVEVLNTFAFFASIVVAFAIIAELSRASDREEQVKQEKMETHYKDIYARGGTNSE